MSGWGEEADGINRGLHDLIGEDPCETACTHFVYAAWTLAGLANVAARNADR